MKKFSSMFIPFCGLFGLIAGQFLWGGGRYAILGMGAGFIVGVVFRMYSMHKPK